MNIDELAIRHQYDYSGYELIDWYEAAFPFWRIQLRVLAQEERPVPVVDEFVLRSLAEGLNEADSISGILGLNQPIVYNSLDQLNRAGYLLIVPAAENRVERINLTNKGHLLLQTLIFAEPMEDSLDICFDATTGEIQKYLPLRQYKELKKSGIHQIPPYHGKIPSLDELDFGCIKSIWTDAQVSLPKYKRGRNLVSVLSVDNSYQGYRPMRVLLYCREDSSDIQVQVYDNAVRSRSHEDALHKMHSQGVSIHPVDQHQDTDSDSLLDFARNQLTDIQTVAARHIREEKSHILRKIIEVEDAISNQPEPDDTDKKSIPIVKNDEVSILKAVIEDLRRNLYELRNRPHDVELLSMLEHRPKLLDVLRTAHTRVIIITPWLKSGAVNDELIDACKSCLQRNVEIIIAFGFDRVSDADEHESLCRLRQLQKTDAGSKLRLRRLRESHAKVLLWDDSNMIVTSFNWLSFGGKVYHGKRRVEYGMLIRHNSLVMKMWNEKLRPLLASSSEA